MRTVAGGSIFAGETASVSGGAVERAGMRSEMTGECLGELALGEPSLGELVLGEPVLGELSLGDSVLGELSLGDSVLGELSLGEPILGELAVGEVALGALVELVRRGVLLS